MSPHAARKSDRVFHRPCPLCGGDGRVELEPWLAATLRLITVSPKAPQVVAEILDLSVTSANNRLKKLVDLGLARREAEVVKGSGGGRRFLYRSAAPVEEEAQE